MSNAVQVFKGPDEVRAVVGAMSERLAQLLPAGMSPERFQATVLRTMLGSPKLMACTQASVVVALQSAAELGLEPSGLLGSAYLVPYKKRRQVDGQWQTVNEAQLIPGYRGLIDLARRSGEVLKVEARTVRQRDTFSIDYGRAQPLQHVPFIADPAAPPEDRDPGPYVGAYMRAMLKGDPVPQVEWMSTDEIEAIRLRSKAADDGPWVTDWSEMARKTVVRRGAKYLPLTTEFRTALELDELAERDAVAPIAAPEPMTPAQRLLAQRIEDRRSVDPETGELHDPAHASDEEVAAEAAADAQAAAQGAQGAPGAAEGSEVAQGPAQAPSDPQRPATAPTGAQAVCGDQNPELGTCSRAPGHPGGHWNEAGVWPRVKA